MSNIIDRFDGEREFLSNFAASPVEYEGLLYPTVEHAFQAAKTFDGAERRRIQRAAKPLEAKKLGRRVELRGDWEKVKINIMKDVLALKFSSEPFNSKLLATGDAELVEGNYWGDTFWGVDSRTGDGENHLGLLLMELRRELKG